MPNKTTFTASPGGNEVVIKRVFDAPLAKVWRAYTEPDLYIQWMGPNGFEGKIDAWDMRPGGKYGYTHTDPAGNSYSFVGYRHLVDPQDNIVETFEWLGMPGRVSLNDVRFETAGNNKTKVTATAVFLTPQDRQAMLDGDMERGVREGQERLDALLKTL